MFHLWQLDVRCILFIERIIYMTGPVFAVQYLVKLCLCLVQHSSTVVKAHISVYFVPVVEWQLQPRANTNFQHSVPYCADLRLIALMPNFSATIPPSRLS